MRLPRLYAVLDDEVAGRFGWTVEDLARACLSGGARLLQIRAKGWPGGRLLEVSERIVSLAAGAGAAVVVNDRADVAQLAGADGVHVGQEDLAPAAVRRAFGDALAIGLSTHSVDQVGRALAEPISYVAVGPVFATGTKATGYDPVGLDLVREAVRAAARAAAPARATPVVAIGGITLDRAASVIDAGASSVAVISDLFAGGDPERRTRAFVERLDAT